jgi:hypothetical protein
MAFVYGTVGNEVGECFHIKSGSQGSAAVDIFDNVVINHNTCDNDANSWMLLQDNGDFFSDLVITNNIGKAVAWFSAIAIPGSNSGIDGFELLAPGPSWTVSNNAVMTSGLEQNWPADNWFGIFDDAPGTLDLYEAIFNDISMYDYTIATGSAYKAGGARDSTTGTDLGCDMTLLPLGEEVVMSTKKLHGRFGR